jgi:acyl-coenzyme A synthetase/AMP-(fatty) acid ligase
VDRDYRLTFREIGRLANNLTSSLQKLGIRRGSVVAFELPNWYHTVVLNLALTRLGALINPIVPIYKEREVSFILKQAKAEVFIIPDTFRNFNYVEMVEKIKPNLPDLKRIIVLGARVPKGMTSLESLLEGDGSLPELEKIDPNDVKLLLYTSGTTAEPKGVQHTHNTLVYTMLNDSGHWGVNQDTVVFMPSPVTHISGYAWALEIPSSSAAESC